MNYEDQTSLNARITFAFKIATQNLPFYPEFWISFALFSKQSGKIEDAISTMTSCCENNREE